MRPSSGSESAEAISDADGKLAFAVPLVPGTEVLISSLDDRFVLDPNKKDDRRILVDAGGSMHHECSLDPRTTIELRAIAASSLHGRVLRPDGQPAASVDVALEQLFVGFGQHWLAFAHAATDRQGHYSFKGCHHLDRPLRVRVQAAAGSGLSAELALAEPGTVVAVPDLKLDAPATVEGTVVDERGRPAPGIRVRLLEWDLAHDRANDGHVVEVITDRQGRWRFVAVPPGGTCLQVLVDQDGTNDRAVPPFEVEAGQRYTFELQLPKPK
jgi:hypothetical protein